MKNGWTDAFVTGPQFEQFLKDQDNAGLVDPDRVGAGMTTTDEPPEHRPREAVDKAQYLVCAVLVAVGAFLIYDAITLEAAFAKVDPVGPKLVPDRHRRRPDRARGHSGHRDTARLGR